MFPQSCSHGNITFNNITLFVEEMSCLSFLAHLMQLYAVKNNLLLNVMQKFLDSQKHAKTYQIYDHSHFGHF